MCLCALLAVGCTGSDAGDADTGTVARVIDGDTLDLASGERIRLIGVDTPETGECHAVESADALARLAGPGTHVELVYGPDRVGPYGRTLAYVEVDGVDVSGVLLERGHGEALTIEPNTARADSYEAEELRARTAGRGMWGEC